MLNYLWPIGLIIFSNVFYSICTKSVPDSIHPLASLTVTYLIGAVFSGVLYYVMEKGNANLLHEYTKMNWAPIVLGLVIVGLEAGYIYAFKAGWQVSMAQIVQAAVVAIILIIVGFIFYKESVTWNKVVGIIACLAGLVFINYK